MDLRRFGRDRDATSAVEFAILLPVFLALLLGAIHVSVALFTQASLGYAVQQGARCASVATCADASAVQNRTASNYYAAGQPQFSYAQADCGNLVTGTVTYDISAVLIHVPVSLSASACFP